jgi:hypothetical protein
LLTSCWRRPGRRQQLVSKPPGQKDLGLVAAGPQQADVRVRRDETRQQAGLADASLALDQHYPGPSGPHSLQLSVKNRELAGAADKMIHPSSVGASGPGRNATLGAAAAAAPWKS